ncbi:GNAT family protein [Ostreiculturibacter nitratireducens]|uniref:GNAT family N-acetyltransferase n=1 Tax=Ostreiculturibacter nitratireducens TaxID=3075226 RepID=UPI0031B5C2A5
MPEFGFPVPGWVPPERPGPELMEGRWARLERLDPGAHTPGLWRAFRDADAVWNYLPYGPFATEAEYGAWAEGMAGRGDPFFYAIRDLETGTLGGVASYLRITPEAGSIEVGHINLSPGLQRTRAATEAMFLMMGWAFGAGYRRYEWKCDALNLPSRRAAERLGFSYEGVFRQAAVVKGRNRDTAWFAVADGDWAALEGAFGEWLAPANFDEAGRQRRGLSSLTAPIRVASDPVLAR